MSQTGLLLYSGRIISSRAGINIIFTTQNNPAGNNQFARPRSPVAEEFKHRLKWLIKEHRPGWSTRYPNYEIFVRKDYLERGLYYYSIYSATPKEQM